MIEADGSNWPYESRATSDRGKSQAAAQRLRKLVDRVFEFDDGTEVVLKKSLTRDRNTYCLVPASQAQTQARILPEDNEEDKIADEVRKLLE